MYTYTFQCQNKYVDCHMAGVHGQFLDLKLHVFFPKPKMILGKKGNHLPSDLSKEIIRMQCIRNSLAPQLCKKNNISNTPVTWKSTYNLLK